MSRCAYCGERAREREHVIPRCLYPESRAGSKVQRLTVKACSECNRGWSDDEAHFRNILAIAGEPNEAVRELWGTTIRRSFDERDGQARVNAVFERMIPVKHEGRQRHKVFPADDSRVMRIVRKVIRGLSHHHRLSSFVSDERVFADVLRYDVPPDLIVDLPHGHREWDIFSYRYDDAGCDEYSSAWLLTFYERTTFIGLVLPPQRDAL